MTKDVNVKKIEEETFRDTMQRGVKQGAVKNSIDKALEKVTGPLAEQMQGLLRKLHPDANIADGAVKGFVEFLTLTGAAEIVSASSVITTKVPGLKSLDENTVDKLGRYLRGYSGEQAGTKVSDTAFAIAPVLTSALSNPGLKKVLDEMSDSVPQLSESTTKGKDLGAGIDQLSEDEE